MNEEQIDCLGSIHFSMKTNGTGPGLTFSNEVIRALGGEVSVKSAWGGHDVTLTIPEIKAGDEANAARKS
jgi:two-component system sporulation sensor kinase B